MEEDRLTRGSVMGTARKPPARPLTKFTAVSDGSLTMGLGVKPLAALVLE